MPTPDAHDDAASLEPLTSEFAGDPDMDELVQFFVGELRARVTALRESWDGGDRRQLQRFAHQLNGAAGGYGFPAITSAAGDLEQALLAEEAELSDLQEKVEALIQLCRRAASSAPDLTPDP
jgi:HPt (histidine-containing phosphotransfer) domain-containing protein